MKFPAPALDSRPSFSMVDREGPTDSMMPMRPSSSAAVTALPRRRSSDALVSTWGFFDTTFVATWGFLACWTAAITYTSGCGAKSVSKGDCYQRRAACDFPGGGHHVHGVPARNIRAMVVIHVCITWDGRFADWGELTLSLADAG